MMNYAQECSVLLKNDGTLPLRGVKRVALFGNGARRTIRGGTGSGEVNTDVSISIEDGLKQLQVEVTTEKWLDAFDEAYDREWNRYCEMLREESEASGDPEFIVAFGKPFRTVVPPLIMEEDVEASRTDTAIYVLGRNSGEGADRFCEPGDYLLYPEERRNLEFLCSHYEKTVLVLNVGGVMDLSECADMEGLNAIYLMSQLGNLGGGMAVQVLLGRAYPSGKLSDTWAKAYRDYPNAETFSHNNGNVNDEYYSEGIYVGYRYFDSFDVRPLYPFGYGLGYTEFSLEFVDAQETENEVRVRAKVTNIGKGFGKEVAQLYVSQPQTELDKPYQNLIAFQKTRELSPGESEMVSLVFPLQALASYSEELEGWVVESGEYVLRLGNQSGDTVPAVRLHVANGKVTTQCRNLMQQDGADNLMQSADEAASRRKNLTQPSAENGREVLRSQKSNTDEECCMDLFCSMEYVRTKTFQYTDPHRMSLQRAPVSDESKKLAAGMTVEEMATLSVGTLRGKKADTSVFGNASEITPGAAGDTAAFVSQGQRIPKLIMADGPAGLRLQLECEKEGAPYRQECTALPIAWAVAQSWNPEFAGACGDLVGQEMEKYHVDIWLAPALNIHRNPLCGRNYEYYSEDPLLSGVMAAAVAQGVQSHPGKAVCFKHFAMNNHEDNRAYTNVHATERTIRELYLKGFELATMMASPVAYMASYNLINGVHAANSYALMQNILRDEWGFDGIVMTDWFSSQDTNLVGGNKNPVYTYTSPAGCVFAGTHLQMPGCQENVDEIIGAACNSGAAAGIGNFRDILEVRTAEVLTVIGKLKGDLR